MTNPAVCQLLLWYCDIVVIVATLSEIPHSKGSNMFSCYRHYLMNANEFAILILTLMSLNPRVRDNISHWSWAEKVQEPLLFILYTVWEQIN